MRVHRNVEFPGRIDDMTRVIGRGRYAGEVYPVASRSSSSPSSESVLRIVWRPNGGGDAQTWAEVMTLLDDNPNVEIYCDQSAASYVITAGSWDLKEAFFRAPNDSPVQIAEATGATILDLSALENVILSCQGTARITFTAPFGVAALVLTGELVCAIQGSGSAAPIQMGAGAQIVFECYGTTQLANNGSAVVDLAAGALMAVRVHDVSTAVVLDDDSVTGTGSIFVITDGSFQATPPTLPGFSGTLAFGAFGTEGGSGPTDARPTNAVATLKPGTVFFDQDETRDIIYDGTDWCVLNQTFRGVSGGSPIVVTAATVIASISGVVLEPNGWAKINAQAQIDQTIAGGDVLIAIRVTRTDPVGAPDVVAQSLATVSSGKSLTLALNTAIQIGGGIGAGTFLFELISSSSAGTSTVPGESGSIEGAELVLSLSP